MANEIHRSKKRIYKNRVYFVSAIPGISGFKQWDKREYGIASGLTARSRFNTVEVGKPAGIHGDLNAGKRFRLDDGHLPDYQPRATFDEACQWVLANPFRIAWIIDCDCA